MKVLKGSSIDKSSLVMHSKYAYYKQITQNHVIAPIFDFARLQASTSESTSEYQAIFLAN